MNITQKHDQLLLQLEKKMLPIMSYNCNFKQSTISSMPMQ